VTSSSESIFEETRQEPNVPIGVAITFEGLTRREGNLLTTG